MADTPLPSEAELVHSDSAVNGKLHPPVVMAFESYGKNRTRRINTGELEDDFVAAVRDPRVDVAVTVKLHGECYKCGSVDEETGEPIFWRRRDLKLSKAAKRRKNKGGSVTEDDFRRVDDGEWVPCCQPDLTGGHWFGWLRVVRSTKPGKGEFAHVSAALDYAEEVGQTFEAGRTYELLGPHVQGNAYNLTRNVLVLHGADVIDVDRESLLSFEGLQALFASETVRASEGVVFYIDGRPAWKLHHGHMAGDDVDWLAEATARGENPYIPASVAELVGDSP